MFIFKISFNDIWDNIKCLTLFQIMILLIIYFSISFFDVFLRKYLLWAMSARAKLKNLVLIHFASMAAHYSTPVKLGFPLTVFFLKRLDNIPYASGTSLVLIELFVSTSVCGLIALAGSLYYFGEKNFLLPIIIFVAGIIISYIFISKVSFWDRFKYIGNLVNNLQNSLKSISLIHLSAYGFLKTLEQLYSSIFLFVLCLFLGAHLSFPEAIVTTSSSFFLGSISMVPIGLGVRESSSLLFLQRFHIAMDVAISAVTLQRLFSTGLGFFIGSLVGAFLGIREIGSDK